MYKYICTFAYLMHSPCATYCSSIFALGQSVLTCVDSLDDNVLQVSHIIDFQFIQQYRVGNALGFDGQRDNGQVL